MKTDRTVVRILSSPANMSGTAEVERPCTDGTMGEKTSRAKLSVALVGVGPTWEQHYRDAIQSLSSKLSVKAICDSVQMRAAVVSDEFEATPISCPWYLTQRKDLHAWLIFDPGWFESYPAHLAVQHGRPALFANTFSVAIPRLRQILQASADGGETLMPEFPQRFTPATTRLRELIATKFGAAQQIDVTVPLQATAPDDILEWLDQCRAEAIGLFDWCRCLIGTSCLEVQFETTDAGTQFRLGFAPRTGQATDTPTAVIRFSKSEPARRQIKCERGSATVTNGTQISWQSTEGSSDETLSNERSPYEIILDQFCRRALGGLVPVPTVHDALKAIDALQLAMASLGRGSN